MARDETQTTLWHLCRITYNGRHEALYWLLTHPKLGPLVTLWQNKQGLPRQVRNRILLYMWFSMGLTTVLSNRLTVVASLLIVGTCVSIYILRQPIADQESG